MFGAKRLALNRDTESVVVLTPNIKLVVRPWSFAITPAGNDLDYFCGQGASGSIPRSIFAIRS
jgi:hypothetical protein